MPFAELELGSGDILVKTEYRDRDRIREVPGTTWDRDGGVWRVPCSWPACVALRGVFKQELQVGSGLNEWAAEAQERHIGPALSLRERMEPVGESLHPRFYPFQAADAEFLLAAGVGILGSEMGTGKTVPLAVITDILTQHGQNGQALVICPDAVKYHWARTFQEWTHLRPIVIEGGAVARRRAIEALGAGEADVGIINWQSLRLHTRLAAYGSVALRKCRRHGGTDPEITPAKCERCEKELNEFQWAVVIADEAHRMKDPKSKQTRAAWQMSQQARHRYAATGTPIANAPDDAWPILHFVSPRAWPSKSKWVDRYALMGWAVYGGMKVIGIRPDTDKEFREQFNPIFRRVPIDAALPQLPAVVRETRDAPLTGKQARAYRQMEEDMIAQLESGDTVVAPSPLTQVIRKLQFSSAYAELEPQPDGQLKVRLSEPSNKLDALEELEADLPESESLVVFAASRQLLELYGKRLDKRRVAYGYITGRVTGQERQRVIDDFQAGRLRYVLCTFGAGSEGVTLTRARIMVFLQRSWSMVDNVQAEGRIRRPGAERHESLLAIDISSGTAIERKQIAAVAEKKGRLEELVRDTDFLRGLVAS